MGAAETGVLKIDDLAGEIGPGIGARAFAETPLGKAAAMKLDGMRTRFFLDRCAMAGRAFRVMIVFEGERLEHVELALLMPGDEKGWAGWTEEGERRRKEEGEAWIQALFCQKAEVLPFEFEGQLITPFEQTWDILRGIRFSWGEVRSYFDSKGGFAGLVVSYHKSR